jgi:hypothetical protein
MSRFYTGSVIDPSGKVAHCNLKADDYITEARALIEGWIEQVYCIINGKKGVMLVDEEGLLKMLPRNPAASAIAGRPIVGTVIVLSEVPRDEE